MPANRFGIDLGEIYRTAEAIKTSRLNRSLGEKSNKLAGMELATAERVEAERPAKEEADLLKKNKLAGLRQEAVGGDENAQRQLLALDPEGGSKFVEAIGKMDDRAKAQAQKNIEAIGSMTAQILQSPTEQRPELYKSMLSQVSEKMRAKMPAEYNENDLNMSLAKLRAMDKILETKSVSFGGKDVLVKGGLEVDRADKPVKNGAAGGGGTKSADESLIYKMSTELLGGIFDQAGNITNLDPEARNRAQAIATEASNLYASGGITRAGAVKAAANKFGLNVGDAPTQNQDISDPNNIRNFLMKN